MTTLTSWLLPSYVYAPMYMQSLQSRDGRSHRQTRIYHWDYLTKHWLQSNHVTLIITVRTLIIVSLLIKRKTLTAVASKLINYLRIIFRIYMKLESRKIGNFYFGKIDIRNFSNQLQFEKSATEQISKWKCLSEFFQLCISISNF